MKKYLIILFLITFSTKSFAIKCDLQKFQIGNDLSLFDKEKEIFILSKINKDIDNLTFPVEFVCKNSEINGTFISLFFHKNKIVRIIYENVIQKNRPLFTLANENYKIGFKENIKVIEANEPEQYAIEKNGVYYLYANIKGINENKGNFFELFEIVDKKHEEIMNKESLELEIQ